MGCCGSKRKPARPNGKTCPKCGWVMNQVHKYNSSLKRVERYMLCSNKTYQAGKLYCGYKEVIK